jgi:hypothetical protein
MLAFRQPTSPEERREWWRRQISRQQSARLPVVQLCRQLGISVTTFYYWKRRVEEADRTTPRRTPAEHSSQDPTVSAGTAVAKFVPVSITGASTTAELELDLANGCAIRFKGSVDPGLLQAAIAAAGQLGGSRRGGR